MAAQWGPVINCHIQRNADLSFHRVTASIQAAKAFFLRLFPEKRFQAFLCYSWLLYPQMAESLSPESKIRRFYQLFEIIGECNDSGQAVENLFVDGKRKELPRMSSLQKMAIEHFDRFGFACGIIKWNCDEADMPLWTNRSPKDTHTKSSGA